MNTELTKKLIDTYPNLFKGYLSNIECGDGWYNLLNELMEKITTLDKDNILKLYQIKEKFYTVNASKDIHNLIDAYDEKSYEICEVCGKKGQLCITSSRWLKTVCKEHRSLETWSGHKQEYLPCYKFYSEEDVIILKSMTLAKVEKLAFDETRDEWKYEIEGKIYYKDELKRKPRQKFYKNQYVIRKNSKTELIVKGVESYNPITGYSYKLTNPVDNWVWNVFEDELEEIIEQTENGWSRKKYRREEKKEEQCQLSNDDYFEAVNGKQDI